MRRCLCHLQSLKPHTHNHDGDDDDGDDDDGDDNDGDEDDGDVDDGDEDDHDNGDEEEEKEEDGDAGFLWELLISNNSISLENANSQSCCLSHCTKYKCK